MCKEVFEVKVKDDKQAREGFPVGCNGCPDYDSDDCHEFCMWPKNYWKYEEVKNYWMLTKAQSGGLDLNRLSSLVVDDFIKLSILKEYL